MSGRLTVACHNATDARKAQAGGADSIVVFGSRADGGMSPEPDVLREVRRAVTIDVRPLVKLRAGFGTDGGEVTRLRGLISDYRIIGADGMVLGFLNGHSEIDTEVLGVLLSDGSWPWTFHSAFDSCLDLDKAWKEALSLPRLDAVVTAGSVRGVEHGLNDLIRLAGSDERIAAMIQAGGGLLPEHVPWLSRAGVRRFQIGSAARPRRSWKDYVDPVLVSSWRSLLDNECG